MMINESFDADLRMDVVSSISMNVDTPRDETPGLGYESYHAGLQTT